ncbi:MAG: UDP-3-O-(3-hydroxymyristoyl)glucosamine N-acyltransferase [Gemmatimonadota bacterium]
MSAFTVGELARHVSGKVEGDATREVSGVAAIESAGPGDLTFVLNERYARVLGEVRPAAVLVPLDLRVPEADATFIRVDDPQQAFGHLLRLFVPLPDPPAGISPTACLGRGVRLDEGVSIGANAWIGDEAWLGRGTQVGPMVLIGSGVRVGENCILSHGCSILEGSRLGNRVHLHPGVRVGTEGFGYTLGPEGAAKVPQVGGCLLEDDVEVGANSTIDRGTLGNTRIGAGTKIDNLVHIGHNVEIGRNCMIVAQVGIAGSVRVGERVALGGQSGISDHITVGDGARIAARAGVIGDVPEGATYSGYPARPHRQALRSAAMLRRLPGLLRRIGALERKLGAGEDSTDAGGSGA